MGLYPGKKERRAPLQKCHFRLVGLVRITQYYVGSSLITYLVFMVN